MSPHSAVFDKQGGSSAEMSRCISLRLSADYCVVFLGFCLIIRAGVSTGRNQELFSFRQKSFVSVYFHSARKLSSTEQHSL